MDVPRKKHIVAEEILWFIGILIVSFGFMMATQQETTVYDYSYSKPDWTYFCASFVILYFLRAIGWGIKTLLRKEPKS